MDFIFIFHPTFYDTFPHEIVFKEKENRVIYREPSTCGKYLSLNAMVIADSSNDHSPRSKDCNIHKTTLFIT